LQTFAVGDLFSVVFFVVVAVAGSQRTRPEKREGRWGARETGIERDGPPVVTGNCPSYPVIHVPHAAVETRAKVATDIACFGACCRRTARNTIKTFKNFEKMFKNSISEPKCFRMTLCLLFV